MKKIGNRFWIRLISIINVTAVAFLFFMSLGFIVEKADHHCEGEHCSVCEIIRQCSDNLKKSAGNNYLSLTAAAVHFAPLLSIVSVEKTDKTITLITQKVRMNN